MSQGETGWRSGIANNPPHFVPMRQGDERSGGGMKTI